MYMKKAFWVNKIGRRSNNLMLTRNEIMLMDNLVKYFDIIKLH